MAAGTVRDWEAEAVRKYLKANGKDIAQAAYRGDIYAQKVWSAYTVAYNLKAPDGSREALNLRDALNDYVLRDLNIKERERLAGLIGHRVEGQEVAPGTLVLPKELIN